MNILLTNDDGYQAPGLRAAYEALSGLGTVHVVAPRGQCSACGHMITIHKPIAVERTAYDCFGNICIVDGTPADCVRLAIAELMEQPLDLVVSGITSGANSGVDMYYSGTVAAAREGAIFLIRSIALSQAILEQVDVDWSAATTVSATIIRNLLGETLPGVGFWSVNLPARLPGDAENHIHRVPVSTHPTPMRFERTERDDGRTLDFTYGAPYWTRKTNGRCDYDVVRKGGIAISAIPVFASF